MCNKTDLGFIEECDKWLLTNRYFPSKVGGKPAWLNLKDIPAREDLICQKCHEPLIFLSQVKFWRKSFRQIAFQIIYFF
jgi:pre-rRNA-processing protein TSR4